MCVCVCCYLCQATNTLLDIIRLLFLFITALCSEIKLLVLLLSSTSLLLLLL